VPRYLIVNADDFGLTEGVSRGIIQAHWEGVVTSTTFMTNFPWAPQMAPLLDEAPDLGVGIHLNLTTGRPLLPAAQVPSLVTKEGDFCKALLHLVARVDPADVEREWAAQIERGIELLGRRPTHLDTHRYLQGYPAFAEVMIRLAKRYTIPAVRNLYPGPQLRPAGRLGSLNPANFLVDRYILRSSQAVTASGLGCPRAILVGDFDRELLLSRLARLEEGVTELVCHPGVVDQQLRSITSLVEQRAVELGALTDPRVRAFIAERGIELVHFGCFATGGIEP
jgi:predicted glycoside hydrolase/deacetylase ChbG (UPF0249 family)